MGGDWHMPSWEELPSASTPACLPTSACLQRCAARLARPSSPASARTQLQGKAGIIEKTALGGGLTGGLLAHSLTARWL